jgi:TonB family protein
MPEPKNLFPKPGRRLLSPPPPQESPETKQRSMMVIALTLLLVALVFVLYRDRDFWFPGTQEAQDLPPEAAASQPVPSIAKIPPPLAAFKPRRHRTAAAKSMSPDTAPAAPSTPPVAAISRTVLPPLEVEVVAGNVHRTLRPNTNSVRVDLQPGSAPQAASEPPVADSRETTASITNAAEHVQMSADTAEVVSYPVKPGYPLLARQMKVQGSVILQALIGRDGLIQDLRVLSGPPILANAAQEAVKQWHFKPHYQGADAVETQAKITVNFTISTN